MARRSNQVVGIDVGTSKVCALIVEPSESGPPTVVGFGSCPSRGMRRGVVVNLEACVTSIKQAVEEAELLAGHSADRAFVGIAGPHVRGLNSRGAVKITGRDQEVTHEDVQRSLESARTVAIPQEREIIHVLPQEYAVDDNVGIHDPVGLTGAKLETDVHIITASVTAAQNLVNCVNRAGVEVEGVVLEQLAAADAVLTQDEKDLGVALIDVGGGTTSLVIFERGAIRHIAVLPTGGEHVSNDEADRIKMRHGCAVPAMIDREDVIEVPGVGHRKPRVLSRHLLCEIIQPRAEEIFFMVAEELMRSGFDRAMHAGVVLTGGGSMLEGMPEIAEEALDGPVRRGAPQRLAGLTDTIATAQYGTAVGLTLYGVRERQATPPPSQNPFPFPFPFPFTRMRDLFKGWFSELF
jgi:cell division protein FtsA